MTARLSFGSPIDDVLERLYSQHAAQNESMAAYFTARAAEGAVDWRRFDARTNEFLRDKLVALERDKAEFCYHVCRALGARRIVEAGTSFGVSTILLAAAVRDNGGGTVVATDYEPDKAAIARRHFAEAGLAPVIALRERGLRRTLV